MSLASVPFPQLVPRRVSEAEERLARDARWAGLMQAAQAGDSRAYETLLRECLPLLRAIVRQRLREPAEVEDAVQDTLLTLHRVRHTYDPSRPFRPWLAAIADRRALDRLRVLARRRGREADLDTAERLGASGDAEARLLSADLRSAVKDLPESQRTALQLTKIEALSLAEASERSRMSIGALKVATHRAVQSLRRRLGGQS